MRNRGSGSSGLEFGTPDVAIARTALCGSRNQYQHYQGFYKEAPAEATKESSVLMPSLLLLP